tara:strand:+ start:1026 stop:1229 length:204 start_codon:yes stop_codon:yes gene_type:complete
MKLQDNFSLAEIAFIEEVGVIFEELTVNGYNNKIEEDLVTDYIMIGGYTTEEAYVAAEAVAALEGLL